MRPNAFKNQIKPARKFFSLRALWLVTALSVQVLVLVSCADKGSSFRTKGSEPFFEGKRTIPVQPYKLPTIVEDRLESERKQEQPDDKQANAPVANDPLSLSKSAQKLELEGLDFTVDLDTKTMSFKGRLKRNGQVIEEVDLKGTFDPKNSLWSSDDLFPTDEKIKAQKKMQATAVCIDTHVCDRVAVRFYYVYEGETLELHFEKDTVAVGAAQSGDSTDPTDFDQHMENIDRPHDQIDANLGEDQLEDLGDQSYLDGDEVLTINEAEGEGQTLPPVSLQENKKKDDFGRKPEDQKQAHQGQSPLEKPDLAPKSEPEPQPDADEDEQYAELPKTGPQPVKRPEAEPKKQTGGQLESVEEILKDRAVEYSTPIQTPNPKVTEHSVKGIEKFVANGVDASLRTQAIDKHTNGRLQNAAALPVKGSGFRRRDSSDKRPNYGADRMINLIKAAASSTEKKYPNRPPISVGNIAAQRGGKLGGHSSHRTGLDADIAFPYKTKEDARFWVPIDSRGNLRSEFDVERFWHFSKGLVCPSASNKERSVTNTHVVAIFLDRRIKAQMCAYAKKIGENLSDPKSCAFRTLRSFDHEAGHHHHIHVRLYCPRTQGCADAMVTLPNKTGC